MKSILSVLILIFGTHQVHSHPKHSKYPTDWRTDEDAYESYRPKGKRTYSHQPKSRILKVYDSVFLKTKLSEFSGALPVKINGKEEYIKERESQAGKKLARAYLRDTLEGFGYKVREQAYSSKGTNLIADKEGDNPDQVVIVSAHMDSVGNAGADDDGSGVISAVSIMGALAKEKLKYSLRFVAFDEEEMGLVGSRAYAKSLDTNKEEVIGVFNLEMTAFNKRKDGAFHVIDCDRDDSVSLTKSIVRAVKDIKLPLVRTEACTDRSDHASFWDIEVPAVVISQNFFGGDSNPCYHRACDKVSDQLNFEYMSNITEAVGLSVKRAVMGTQ
ncbi:MAG: M28 family peptidase [Xanthomonadaceae bacterium]|nr:M28 family peptidase [Xanthomonadaceae bacterium]